MEEEPLLAVLADNALQRHGHLPHDVVHRLPRFVRPDRFIHDVRKRVVGQANHERRQQRRPGRQRELGRSLGQARRSTEKLDGTVRRRKIAVADHPQNLIAPQRPNTLPGRAAKGNRMNPAGLPILLVEVVNLLVRYPECDRIELVAQRRQRRRPQLPVTQVRTDEDDALIVLQQAVQHRRQIAVMDDAFHAPTVEAEELEKIDEKLREVQEVFARQ